jgi:hypothetical protein
MQVNEYQWLFRRDRPLGIQTFGSQVYYMIGFTLEPYYQDGMSEDNSLANIS